MISMDKKYATRDGREVRIYAVDGSGPYPVHGAVALPDGWNFQTWELTGQWAGKADRHGDLIEVKPKITRTYWLCHTGNATDCNLYGWTDKAEAEKWARQVKSTIAITGPHEITFTPGDGL